MNKRMRNSLVSVVVFVWLPCVMSVSAQELPFFVKAKDKAMLKQRAQEFYNVVDPLVKKISDSTVLIKADEKVISMGTVTQKGIVTKYSELAKVSKLANVDLRMVAKDGSVYPVNILHGYSSYDIAILENVGKLPAVDFKTAVKPKIGSFIVASGAADQALGVGVVSVKPRSLKENDRGFLGVVMDMQQPKDGGIRLMHVEPQSAADLAGLKQGDIVLTIEGEQMTNMLEMRNILQKQTPGDEIVISYKRGRVVSAGIKVKLGARKEMPQIRDSRMNTMKRMGGKINMVSEGFPQVLQSDMKLKSKFCGAPVIDLDQNLVGVVVARASRIKTYIIEAEILSELLESVPDR